MRPKAERVVRQRGLPARSVLVEPTRRDIINVLSSSVQGEYPETSSAVITVIRPGVLAPLRGGRDLRDEEECLTKARARMSVSATRFVPRTLAGLDQLLVARRDSISRCVGALGDEAVDALSAGDRSDLFDAEDPAPDSAGAAALMLSERADRRLWEVEQALARMRDGTYGYCVGCGAGIPLQRLRAVPATANCVACSAATVRDTTVLSGGKRTRATTARGQSWAKSGTSVPRVGE